MPEQTYLVFHPTRLAFFKWYLLAFIIIIAGVFVVLCSFQILSFKLPIPEEYNIYTVFIPFIGIIFIIIGGLLRKVDTYYITNFRIVEKRGIINTKEDSINWEKISNYSLSQSALDRIFNVGTIRLYSMGGIEEEAEVTIKKVSNIHKIKALLDKLIERKVQGPVV